MHVSCFFAGIVGVVFTISIGSPVPAQRAPLAPTVALGASTDDPVLDALIATALRSSPVIHAAIAREKAASARVGPAGARPDPMLMAGIQNLPPSALGFSDEMTMAMIGVSRTVPLRGKLGLRQQVAQHAVDVHAAERVVAQLELTRDIRIAYYEIAYLERARSLLASNHRLLVDLVQVAAVRYASGAEFRDDSSPMASDPVPRAGSPGTSMVTSGLPALLRARIAVTALANDDAALEEERLSTLARLNALLDRPSDTRLDSASIPLSLARHAVAAGPRDIRFVSATLGARAASSPLPSLAAVQQLAERTSPVLRANEARISAQQSAVELARRERTPDLDVALLYGVRPGRPDMITASVAVPLLLQRRRVQEPLIAAAREDLAGLEAEQRAGRNTLRAEVARTYGEAERARTTLALLTSAMLPQEQAVLEATLSAFRSGTADLEGVLTARATLFNRETAYVRALTDFAKAIAVLDALVGVTVLP